MMSSRFADGGMHIMFIRDMEGENEMLKGAFPDREVVPIIRG